jgi:hypothetical protein
MWARARKIDLPILLYTFTVSRVSLPVMACGVLLLSFLYYFLPIFIFSQICLNHEQLLATMLGTILLVALETKTFLLPLL